MEFGTKFCCLQIGRKNPAGRVAQLDRQGLAFQILKADFAAPADDGVDMPGQQAVEGGIKDFHIQFEVQAQAAGVQIGRADLAVIAVHGQQLGMGKGRRLVPDPHPGR